MIYRFLLLCIFGQSVFGAAAEEGERPLTPVAGSIAKGSRATTPLNASSVSCEDEDVLSALTSLPYETMADHAFDLLEVVAEGNTFGSRRHGDYNLVVGDRYTYGWGDVEIDAERAKKHYLRAWEHHKQALIGEESKGRSLKVLQALHKVLKSCKGVTLCFGLDEYFKLEALEERMPEIKIFVNDVLFLSR